MEGEAEEAAAAACPCAEGCTAEAQPPLTAATQKESFAAVGRATAALLAAAYCRQDPELVQKLAEELHVTGDPLLCSSEAAEGAAAEGRREGAADSSASTPNPEKYEESLSLNNPDEENSSSNSSSSSSSSNVFSLSQVPLGQAKFSGNLTISPQGALTVVGPGEWVAGRRHGFGEQLFADGSRYEGQWVDGVQEGQGLMIWKEPSVQYVGEWKKGTASGWGRQTWIETPDFDSGGTWTVGRNLQQNQYEGQFQNGRREGVGAFSYSNGARYEGSWVADQKHGIGTFKSETGAIYEGLFVYDRMAEAPPSNLDDPVKALVDLSTAQQVEVYKHLDAYSGPDLWTQLLLSSGSDENFQRARRLSGGTPATLTVIESERRRSSQLSDLLAPELTARSSPHAAAVAATAAVPAALPWGATDEAPAAATGAEQQQDSAKPSPAAPAPPGTALSVPTSEGHLMGRPEKTRPSAHTTISEDSLRLHRRPVLFPAFLRALVLLLQMRLRSLRRHRDRNHAARRSGNASGGGFLGGVDLDDPSCLSLAWIALCRKLRVFSEVLERQMQTERKGASNKGEDTPNEPNIQALARSASIKAEASDSGPNGGLSRAPSEQSQAKQSLSSQPPTSKQDPPSQRVKRFPSSVQSKSKSSVINRQQSAAVSTTRQKGPDAARGGVASGPAAANDSRAKDVSLCRGDIQGESCVRSSEEEEAAAAAGRHAEIFRQAAFAEDFCIIDEALHRALFTSSRQHADSSASELGNSAGIPGAVVCNARDLFRLLDIAGLVLPSDNQQADKGHADKGNADSAIMLRTTPLTTFALPAVGLVAVMLEVLPASVELNSFHQQHRSNKDHTKQQEHKQEQQNLQEDADPVEAPTAALDDATAAKRDEIQRQQQQQLLLLEQQQQQLREALAKGLLSWTEIAAWKLTFVETPPPIAALLSLKLQVEEFLRLLSAVACPPLRDPQQLLHAEAQEQQQQHQVSQQFSLSGDDTPAARSDATVSAATTADGEQPQRCFCPGFCEAVKGRPIYDMPLKIDESMEPEASDSEDGAESEASNSLS
ncbi:Fbox and MORN domain containing protein, related [Eimeria brunetti]|uniref:Fbox and MORN domain containing protein, related n=1 Tax=Eimeria brunetti TaxID=51314 RepID=U6LJD4_9EIME|nr:Fbox and MORN domain containing protein, related [Eimeria brunetti]